MFPGSSFDPSYIILLLLGKDNSWIPFIIIIVVIFQKWSSIIDLYNTNVCTYGKTQYKVSGTFYINFEEGHTYGQLDTSMWALIRFINDLIEKNTTLLSNATNIKFPHNEVFEDNDIILIPTSNTILNLTEYVKCHIELVKESRDSGKSQRSTMIDSTTITFTLTTTKTFEILTKFMHTIIDEHIKVIKLKNKTTKYIIKPIFSNASDPDVIELSHPDRVDFNSSKSFDNLFFDGKKELIKRLDTFVNRDKYKTLGLPETLGLLFYGAPGTGKTSCIKAVANYLDMSLMIVPMNRIKTKKRLEELFFCDRISTPQEKRIYVFEEIDCNGWENIIRHRSLIKEETTIEDNSKNILAEKITDSVQVDKSLLKDKNEDKLTLGGILEIIDGLIECPGRVIIMTTNHNDQIDSALLRPGRIDMQIEFKKLRHCHIAEIYKKWYGVDLKEYSIDNIPDYIYSQAEISQLLFKYENDPIGFISEITQSS